MYEQYTDKQIVEMLKPKLEKLGFTEFAKQSENYPMVSRLCATLYKSGYIRGQLGRSFIIGEPKQTEHWVLATEDNVKVGSKVRMSDGEGHRDNPQWFPDVGTIGTIINTNDATALIQWPSGATSKDDRWLCSLCNLEVLLCE